MGLEPELTCFVAKFVCILEQKQLPRSIQIAFFQRLLGAPGSAVTNIIDDFAVKNIIDDLCPTDSTTKSAGEEEIESTMIELRYYDGSDFKSVLTLYRKCIEILQGETSDEEEYICESIARCVKRVCLYVEEKIDDWFAYGPEEQDNSEHQHHQAEIAIRLFPSLLLSENLIREMADNACLRSSSLVPLLAKVALEYGRVHDRGGLLAYATNDRNALRCIAGASRIDLNSRNREILFRTDEINLNVMKELRFRKLLFREDIEREDLVSCCLTKQNIYGQDFYAEQRFRYLANWDPHSLGRENQNHCDGILPLHRSILSNESNSNILTVFRTVLDLGTQHFPSKFGFLFHMDKADRTPFFLACERYGSEEATRVVEDVLSSNNYNATLESLVYLAVDDSVHLEGIYNLLRRDPSVLVARAASLTCERGSNNQKRKQEIIEDNNNRSRNGNEGKAKRLCSNPVCLM